MSGNLSAYLNATVNVASADVSGTVNAGVDVLLTSGGVTDVSGKVIGGNDVKMDSAGKVGVSGEVQATFGSVNLTGDANADVSGVIDAAVAVVATEPIRAFLGGDGLGRYVRDGLGQNNDTLKIGGAILVAGLAAVTALALGAVERWGLPAGARHLRQVQDTRTGDTR